MARVGRPKKQPVFVSRFDFVKYILSNHEDSTIKKSFLTNEIYLYWFVAGHEQKMLLEVTDPDFSKERDQYWTDLLHRCRARQEN